ncbi:nicotinate-nucleotide adenylyltransferase [Marivita hallyeonensis]|uniref:Probable nicotinate-nucleotide adenylyltransferase n=1 Tax=Marivita hallyeonensis TaxID=996342 RepID=A0A1M5NL98_9RHOB|nr:nicotinate-nucleotide adenylyltransferase [Marivita hallyeonensis]SHG89969.1 nicotinate-nucleotide adenylyltransferase [Marivita hallyeonensis]
MHHARLPLRPGMAVGLLGGSFDPAHDGHVHLTKTALTRFGLDRVIWLVSPGNPLKAKGPAPLSTRVTHARDIMQDPRVLVSDFEAQVGTRYTAATLDVLLSAYPGVRFVWLMGADNLQQFHRWDRWEDILNAVPLGVLARPGWRQSALHSRAARQYRACRIHAQAARLLAHSSPPSWCFVNMPMTPVSSTQIRENGGWTTA